MPPVNYDETCNLLAEATALLLQSAQRLDDPDVRAASLLPGWSRGHVLTHLARNADGLLRLTVWATSGEPSFMYPSRAARDGDIEAGSGRSAEDLRADLTAASSALAEGLAGLPPGRYGVEIDNQGTLMRADVLAWLRLREVALHGVDLDCGLTCEDIASPVRARLLTGLRSRPAFAAAPALRLVASDTGGNWTLGQRPTATVTGTEAELLAWTTGRASGEGLSVQPAGPLPALPAWG